MPTHTNKTTLLICLFLLLLIVTAFVSYRSGQNKSLPVISGRTRQQQGTEPAGISNDINILSQQQATETVPLLTDNVKKIVSVYDGDTFKIDLDCTEPVFCTNLSIRVNGVDTPELKTTDVCEKHKAEQAKQFTTNFLRAGKVKLSDCKRDKYFRLVCNVSVEGKNLADALISSGLAYPYYGKTKQHVNWCNR